MARELYVNVRRGLIQTTGSSPKRKEEEKKQKKEKKLKLYHDLQNTAAVMTGKTKVSLVR
jgi:hypothetical protein